MHDRGFFFFVFCRLGYVYINVCWCDFKGCGSGARGGNSTVDVVRSSIDGDRFFDNYMYR